MDIFLMLTWNAIPILCLYIFWRGKYFNLLMVMAMGFIILLQIAQYRAERIKDAQRSLIATQSELIEEIRYWVPDITPGEGK